MPLVKVAGPAQWHGLAFLLRRRQRHRWDPQRCRVVEPSRLSRACGEVRRVSKEAKGQGRSRRTSAQPRREPRSGFGYPAPL